MRAGGADTLVVTDLGYRIVVATDALCSSSDETHDALIGHYRDRYGQQIETADTEERLADWLRAKTIDDAGKEAVQ